MSLFPSIVPPSLSVNTTSPPLTSFSRNGPHSYRRGGPILNSFGKEVISDSSYAHHSMSPRALKDAKFSPGLGQAEAQAKAAAAQGFGVMYGRRRSSNSGSSSSSPPITSLQQTFRRRDRYLENHASRGGAGADDDDEDDAYEMAVRRRRQNSSSAPPPLAPVFKPFDPKTARVEPRVPKASEATHTPGGGNVKIVSKKMDLSHVTPKVPSARIAAPQPKSSDVIIWNDPDAKNKYAHVQPTVVTASEAAKYKPAGGNVSILHRKLEWHAEPTVPSAAEASKYKPKPSEKTIFNEKLTFRSQAHHSDEVVSAKDASRYKSKGGDNDVFLWKKSPDTRRPHAAPKTEEELFEELFPNKDGLNTSAATAADQTREEKNQSTTTAAATAAPNTSRRRREMLLLQTD